MGEAEFTIRKNEKTLWLTPESLLIKTCIIAAKGSDSESSVIEASRTLHVRVRKVELLGEWWKTDGGHMIAFMKADAAPVCMINSSHGGYRLFDPIKGLTTNMGYAVAEELKPFAYEFYYPFPDNLSSWKGLLKFCFNHIWKKDILMVFALGLLGSATALLIPLVMNIIFSMIIPDGDRVQLFKTILILLAGALAAFIFQIARGIAMLRIDGKVDIYVQSAVMDRMLKLPISFFRQFSSSDLAERAVSIALIRKTVSTVISSTFISGIFSISYLFMLFFYNRYIAATAVFFAVVQHVFAGWIGYLRFEAQYKEALNQMEANNLAFQVVCGISRIRISFAENRIFSLFGKKYMDLKRTSFYLQRIRNIQSTFESIYFIVASMILFILITNFGLDKISMGAFAAVMMAFNGFLFGMKELSRAAADILDMAPVFSKLKPILEANPEVDGKKEKPGDLKGEITVENLRFSYHKDQKEILNDISFHVKPGQMIAFVGSSGSGKSTLLRLLLGFEKPLSGSIFYDGQDIESLDIQALRRQMGVVLQNATISSGDIFSNIVGTLNLTVDDAWEIARMVGLDKDIEDMPMGMHTIVNEGGTTLSGGQCQRLLIARAISNKPVVVFFDEATSMLDNNTQGIVVESLNRLKMTRLVIAHRLSTVMSADQIYVVDNGRIVQSGTYTELIEQDGIFAEFTKRQMM